MDLSRDHMLALSPVYKRALIDLLIDAGLLAAEWTIADLGPAIDALLDRIEIVTDMQCVGEGMEDALFRRAQSRNAYNCAWMKEYRADPLNEEHEKKTRQKHIKKQKRKVQRASRERKQQKRRSHAEYLLAERRSRKSKLAAKRLGV